jgi:hypothetical protein
MLGFTLNKNVVLTFSLAYAFLIFIFNLFILKYESSTKDNRLTKMNKSTQNESFSTFKIISRLSSTRTAYSKLTITTVDKMKTGRRSSGYK